MFLKKEMIKTPRPPRRGGALASYRLRAGELGGYVEVDEVFSHQDVRHAIAVVGDLRDPAR